MKSKLFKTFVILLGFIIGILITFPLKTLAISFMSKNDIKFTEIKGNSFELNIKGIQKGNIHIQDLKLKNYFIFQHIFIKNGVIKIYPILRKANLNFKNFELHDIYKSDDIDIKINKGNLDIFLRSEYILIDGKGDLDIKKLQGFQLDNTNLKVELKKNEKENYTEINADIKGTMIEGNFSGKLVLNIKDKNQSYLEGVFRGKIFNNAIEKEIKQPLDSLF